MRAPKPPSVRHVVGQTLDHLFERQSTVSTRAVMQHALTLGVGHISQEAITSELHRRGAIIHHIKEREMLTLPHILREEQGLVKQVRAGRGTKNSLVAEVVFKQGTRLNRSQQNAIRHILTSTDQVVALSGPAGTGLKTIAIQIKKTEKEIIAVAPTTDASRGTLRKQGFTSANTIAKLLQDETLQKQLKNNVLWVDEASQAGVVTLSKLLTITKKQNARVILTGDPKQHRSIERGDGFRLLSEFAGMQVVSLDTIVRQKTSLYKNAVSALHHGKMTLAIEWLHTMNAFTEITDNHSRYAQLAEEYFTITQKGQSALIVSPTHFEADQIIPHIRTRLKQASQIRGKEQTRTQLVPLHFTESQKNDERHYRAGYVIQLNQNIKGFTRGEQLQVVSQGEKGKLHVLQHGQFTELPIAKSKHFEVYQPKHIQLAKGDTIRITRNSYSKYSRTRLNRGAEYTIDRINQHGDLILNNGVQLHKEFNHLNYAYISTSYASQSKTVDQILIAQSSLSFGEASSKEQFYVSVSRGRRGVSVYTDDLYGLKKALTKTTDRLSATELAQKKNPKTEWFNAVKSTVKQYKSAVASKLPTMARPLNHPSKANA